MKMDRTLSKARKKRTSLSGARLRELLTYDSVSGLFRWNVQKGSARAGDTAGLKDNGYILIGIDGNRYQAHALAWLYVTGSWPSTFIDHRDGDRSNNTWSNLRAASRSQNNRNAHVRSHSATGLKGVQKHRNGKFMAKIQFGGKQHYLGLFDTAALAHAAYQAAAVKHYGEFARG